MSEPVIVSHEQLYEYMELENFRSLTIFGSTAYGYRGRPIWLKGTEKTCDGCLGETIIDEDHYCAWCSKPLDVSWQDYLT